MKITVTTPKVKYGISCMQAQRTGAETISSDFKIENAIDEERAWKVTLKTFMEERRALTLPQAGGGLLASKGEIFSEKRKLLVIKAIE